MKTYDEFKKDWFGGLPADNGLAMPDLLEYFCECDYKRYVGDWKESL